jgi:predicted metal-dependent hydrolase
MVSVKIAEYTDYGTVKYQKKKGLKRVSMRLHDSGELRVSLPYHVPWFVAEQFVKSHHDWIIKQKINHQTYEIIDGQQIGKSYKIVLKRGDGVRTQVRNNIITITYNKSPVDPAVILSAKKAIKRALTLEAKEILPDRVEQLAIKYGYEYKSMHIKPMKTRWGSCDTHKHINLNCYLMQLPWPLIDYVIAHELAHTKQMNHSQKFWNEVAQYSPNYKEQRKLLKEHHKSIRLLYV